MGALSSPQAPTARVSPESATLRPKESLAPVLDASRFIHVRARPPGILRILSRARVLSRNQTQPAATRRNAFAGRIRGTPGMKSGRLTRPLGAFDLRARSGHAYAWNARGAEKRSEPNHSNRHCPSKTTVRPSTFAMAVSGEGASKLTHDTISPSDDCPGSRERLGARRLHGRRTVGAGIGRRGAGGAGEYRTGVLAGQARPA